MGAPESLKPNDLRTSAKFTPRRLESSFNVHSAPKAKEVPENGPLCPTNRSLRIC